MCKGSFEEAVFLEKFKITKVIPVFKKGDKENIEIYRPISSLPVFSKVLKRIMYNRLYEDFMNNNLLHENQFCFQINNSTEIQYYSLHTIWLKTLIMTNLH